MLRSRRARVRPCSCREHADRLTGTLPIGHDRSRRGRQATGERVSQGMLAVRKERSKPALFDRPRPRHRRGDPVTASGAATSGDRELRPPCRFPSPAPTPSQWQTRSAPTSTRPTPPADVYLLSKVLNDWPDRETTASLTRCAEAGRPSGVVPAVGGAAPDAPGPSPHHRDGA